MKKRNILFAILLISLVLVSSLLIAQDNASDEKGIAVDKGDSDSAKIDKAYECLDDLIDDKTCDKLSSEERVFSLLTTGKCKSEVADDDKYESDVKFTAQAILALDRAGSSVSDAAEWLSIQNATPQEIVWYLQIESDEETTCSVSYSDSSYTTRIGLDKKLSSGAGSCLSLSEGNYWLRVAPSCYGTEFEISCDQDFLTSLLYKKTASSTIHVSEKTQTTLSGGILTEKIKSLCFAQSGTCDYEASLWSTLVSDYLGEDVSHFMPYLITMADENPQFLPEAFLYPLTNFADFRDDLLQRQAANKYWDVSGDKVYDTALALSAITGSAQEKTNSKKWLLENQDEDGCWQGNIRNTAYVLYVLEPRRISGGDTKPDCEAEGNYCLPKISCTEAGGSTLLTHGGCAYPKICCDEQEIQKSCPERQGTICSQEKICKGEKVSTPDLRDGETCCVRGTCEEPSPQETECEQAKGICRQSQCKADEVASTEQCEFTDVCCKYQVPQKGSLLWLWILIVLIILVIIGIVFRDKLRPYWFRVKSTFKKPGPKPGFKPGTPRFQGAIPGRPIPRRIPSPRPARRPLQRPGRPRAQPKGELNNVLKKLKEMGK